MHFNLVHLIDHVIVRNDVPFVRHNHAGAERILHEGFLVRIAKLARVSEEKLEGIERLFAPGNLFRRLDGHNRRHHAVNELAPFPVQRFE